MPVVCEVASLKFCFPIISSSIPTDFSKFESLLDCFTLQGDSTVIGYTNLYDHLSCENFKVIYWRSMPFLIGAVQRESVDFKTALLGVLFAV